MMILGFVFKHGIVLISTINCYSYFYMLSENRYISSVLYSNKLICDEKTSVRIPRRECIEM